MLDIKTCLVVLGGTVAYVAAAPAGNPAPAPLPTTAPELGNVLEKRASCTFTAASAVSASKKSCATIVLDNIAVPSGTTLDLTSLADDTHVRPVTNIDRKLLTSPRLFSRAQLLSATKHGLVL